MLELQFQMQAMTKMMESMNFMMGNVCGRLEKVVKHGNVAGTCTQDVRKVGAEPKSNNGRTRGIELGANSAKGKISVVLGDMLI
jgi:hypothetical protein